MEEIRKGKQLMSLCKPSGENTFAWLEEIPVELPDAGEIDDTLLTNITAQMANTTIEEDKRKDNNSMFLFELIYINVLLRI